MIIEYVGEVIDDDESYRRLQRQAAKGEQHVFQMQLMTDRVIDAFHKGNIARFINHSCDPNCELQKWRVGEHQRIAIVALKDIPKDTELTYDYQFFSKEKTVCLCGASNCRGSLAAPSVSSLKREEQAQTEKHEGDLLRKAIKRNRGALVLIVCLAGA